MFLTPMQYNEIYSPTTHIIINGKISEEIHQLETKLQVALEFIDMVEDNSKMPHQHSDYYLRLCCLAERATEIKLKLKAN